MGNQTDDEASNLTKKLKISKHYLKNIKTYSQNNKFPVPKSKKMLNHRHHYEHHIQRYTSKQQQKRVLNKQYSTNSSSSK